jgi:hypothetical protein
MDAAGADLRAAPRRIPRCVRPLDFRIVTHASSSIYTTVPRLARQRLSKSSDVFAVTQTIIPQEVAVIPRLLNELRALDYSFSVFRFCISSEPGSAMICVSKNA